MSRETSPYIVGEFWLDQRRDGRAKGIWQIARAERGTIIYRSTRTSELDIAKAALEAHLIELRSLKPQSPEQASVVAHLANYWREKGCKAVNSDQTCRSLRAFAAFLDQDRVGARAVVSDLTPVLFERFRSWRMGPHAFDLQWFDQGTPYSSQGVAGATVQRNINDIRAAIHHAEANMRIPMAPKIHDLPEEYRSPPRERILSKDELARIAWYAAHNIELFRFVALQMATAVRPQAALKFDPRLQFDAATGLIDLQPHASRQTKKRNAIVPAIRPLHPILRKWAAEGAKPVGSHKTAWRIMRRTLGLSDDVLPKTIRHTVATLLYADPTVPEREIVELLGHEGKLARTTRIYAKYDPERLVNVKRALTTLWVEIHALAKAFASDHRLTTVGQGGKNYVELVASKC